LFAGYVRSAWVGFGSRVEGGVSGSYPLPKELEVLVGMHFHATTLVGFKGILSSQNIIPNFGSPAFTEKCYSRKIKSDLKFQPFDKHRGLTRP
jgi:hypothetical protein